MIDLQSVIRIVKNDSKLKIKIFSIFNPNQSLGNYSAIINVEYQEIINVILWQKGSN